jgi:hypothetical protein
MRRQMHERRGYHLHRDSRAPLDALIGQVSPDRFRDDLRKGLIRI